MSGGSVMSEPGPSHSQTMSEPGPSHSQTMTRKKDEEEDGSTESKKYAKIPIESIKIISEACGFVGLKGEALTIISEDVSYRLREIIHLSKVFLRQSKRKKLLTSDIDEVFEDCGVPPIFGHSSSQDSDLVYIKEAGVFVVKDDDEDLHTLAFDKKELFQLGDPFIKDFKVAPTLQEAPQVEPQQSEPIANQEDDTPTANTEVTDEDAAVKFPPHLLNYYNLFTSVVLGSSNKQYELFLSDFKTNKKIGALIPCVLNVLSKGLEKIPTMRSRFLRTVLVLTRNEGIELDCNPSVHRLVSALLLCALDTKTVQDVSVDDEYLVKMDAALVLSRVVSEWCQGETKLQLDIVQKLGAVLLNGSSPLKSHYGALVCLVSLGSEALEYCLWPHLAQYLSFLEAQPQDHQVKQVEGAILSAYEVLYRLEWASMSDASTLPEGIQVVDGLLESYFGEALCTRRICHGVRTYEENSGYAGLRHIDPYQVYPKGQRKTYWANAGKTPLFSSYQAKKQIPTENANNAKGEETATMVLNLNRSKKYNVSEIFDISPLNSQKDEKGAIQMNFAGGKPAPRENLVTPKRCLDKNHSQFIGPSRYAITNYKAGCTGPQITIPKKLQPLPLMKSNIPPSNEDLLYVL